MLAEEFDARFRAWVAAFCESHRRPEPLPDRVEKALTRIPEGLKAAVVLGFKNNIVLDRTRYTFSLRGLEQQAYPWIAASGSAGWRAEWKRIVQVAEYARVALTAPPGFKVGWQEDQMDVTLRGPAGALVACYAIEDDLNALDALTKGVQQWGKRGVRPDEPGTRGGRARQIARALVSHPTRFFSTVGVGERFEFGVQYGRPKGAGVRFRLEPDVIPFPQVAWPSVIGSKTESAPFGLPALHRGTHRPATLSRSLTRSPR